MVTHGFGFGSLNARKTAPRKSEIVRLKPQKRDGAFVMLSTVCNGECRWPYNLIAGDLVMCGRPVERGAPYCKEHRELASGGQGGRL